MKATFVICFVLSLALVGLQCTPSDSLSISVTEDEVKVSVMEVDNGIEIINVSKLGCVVFVRSPEGEQKFDLDVGESVIVTDITKPIEVAAVSR